MTAFTWRELGESLFPLVIEYIDHDSGAVVQRFEITEPSIMKVPKVGDGFIVRISGAHGEDLTMTEPVDLIGPARMALATMNRSVTAKMWGELAARFCEENASAIFLLAYNDLPPGEVKDFWSEIGDREGYAR